jgi:hypothetical protein
MTGFAILSGGKPKASRILNVKQSVPYFVNTILDSCRMAFTAIHMAIIENFLKDKVPILSADSAFHFD